MPEILSLAELRDKQQLYLPKDEILRNIAEVSMLLFVGPAGVGKSTTLDTMTQQDSRFGRTGSIGTRPVDARDKPGLYRQLGREEMVEKIAQREVVQYAVHPTTDTIYATLPTMYQKEYNMLETLPGAVEGLQRLPFKETRVLYIVTGPTAWQKWFEARYPQKDDERQKRLREAMSSLAWALSQPEGSIAWVKNMPGNQEETAKTCIKLVANPIKDSSAYHSEAEAMLAVAKAML